MADAPELSTYNPQQLTNTISRVAQRLSPVPCPNCPMLCPACSTEIAAGSVFCPKCGHRTSDPAPGAAGGATPAQQLRAGNRPIAAGDEPEKQLWHGSYSPKAMYGSWMLATVVTLVAIAVSI